MVISDLWNAVTDSGPAALVLVGATLSLFALPIVRRLAPANRRNRGGPARFFLIIALLLAVGAIGLGTMGATSPGNMLQVVGVLALMMGLVGVAGVFLFDVTLPRLRIEVPSILRDLTEVAVAVAIGMGFLRLAGLDVFSLVTTSAVLTAVIGLALQSTIANVFSGLGLQMDRTLRQGEWIEVGSHIGKILEIGWRSTRIETKDGDTIFVPNSELVSKEVRNFARPNGAHRVTVRIGFHYRHPPNDVCRSLLDALRDVSGVLCLPEPTCGPVEFGDFAVIYALRYWIADFAHESTVDEEVHARLWYAAQRSGLEIPFPIRTLIADHEAKDARVVARANDETAALQLLATVAPFSRLDDADRARCAHNVRRMRFAADEVILRADGPDHLYVVAEGEVSVRCSSNGVNSGESTVRTGELVGRRVLPDSAAIGCLARSEVVLYKIDDAALREALDARPELAAELAAIAAARQIELEKPTSEASGRGNAAGSGTRLGPRLRRLFK
jgi:small-conductance mechanosensitive channel